MPRKHDRCTGHCCEKFTLRLSPEELAASYRQWLGQGGDSESIEMNGTKPATVYRDIYLIAPMVRYLGFTYDHPPKINPSDNELLNRPKTKRHYYTCKHFDPKTRDCTIYEIRPAMCRSYPDAGLCNYAKCTWKAKRAKKQTTAELRRRKNDLVTKAKAKKEVTE